MNISDLLTNSELKPGSMSVDVRASKDLMFGDFRLTLFARVFNLLDTKNELQVYNDSGTANWTEPEYQYRQMNVPPLVNTLDEYYRNPLFYSEPRRVEFGASVFF